MLLDPYLVKVIEQSKEITTMKQRKIFAVLTYLVLCGLGGPLAKSYAMHTGGSGLVGWCSLIAVCLAALLIVNYSYGLNVLDILDDVFDKAVGIQHSKNTRRGQGND